MEVNMLYPYVFVISVGPCFSGKSSGTESLVFQFAIQKFKDQVIQNYNFALTIK
jgi:hypothetical protein